jgi:protein-S-isoprenylcysteine O-methyltransferase Ste14
MEKIIVFAVLGAVVTMLSWRTLSNIRSHGFYRYFSWLCIAWLVASNYSFWFDNPFALEQLISWFLLFVGLYLVVAGVVMMKRLGSAQKDKDRSALYQFEQTTELVDSGIFRYIRHPLYSSLVFLTWGIFFKNTTLELFCISMLSSVFLYLTARQDEKECIAYFGEKYVAYMKRSKRFVPFVF